MAGKQPREAEGITSVLSFTLDRQPQMRRRLLLRATLSRADYMEIYRLFDLATPLPFDCGTMCGKMCCLEWEPGVGMYLYPGEESMFEKDEDWLVWEEHDTAEYEFCPEWQGKVPFIMCKRPCPRQRRPIECRTFPLAPHLTTSGDLQLVLDPDGLHLCPLVRGGELELLDPAFVTNARRAWELLLEDPLIRADVLWRSRLRQGC